MCGEKMNNKNGGTKVMVLNLGHAQYFLRLAFEAFIVLDEKKSKKNMHMESMNKIDIKGKEKRDIDRK